MRYWQDYRRRAVEVRHPLEHAEHAQLEALETPGGDYTLDRIPALWEALRSHHRGRRRNFKVRAAERTLKLLGFRGYHTLDELLVACTVEL